MLYGDMIHDDTPAIQELLDKCGTVYIDRPGTYLVSSTLIIHSNTRFILSPGAKLLAAPLSKCALIQNEHFADGSIRDENIEIIGGIWDGNCDEMGLDAVYEAKHREDFPYSPSLFKGKLIRFAHIDRLSLEKMTVKDPVSYGVQIADANGFIVRDIYFDYNWHFGTTDGIHVNGPSYNGVIENLYGTTNDDMIGMTTIDETHAEVTMGEIVNVYIHNISAANGYSGVRLLSAGNFDMRNIHISGVYGDYRHNAVLVSHHNTRPNTRIWFDDIIIEHVRANKSSTPLGEDCFTFWEKGAIETLPVIWFEKGINVGNAILRDISRHETANTQGALIQLDKGAEIDRLIIDNVYQTLAPGVDAPKIKNEATIKELIERDV
ncbi:MAG: hypothetical protein E7633_09410 [Ruminococcaceae bacterium]|nr:hypothetical protein [Oscillospiraceae bacterium]